MLVLRIAHLEKYQTPVVGGQCGHTEKILYYLSNLGNSNVRSNS